MTALLAHAGGVDEITYAVSLLIFAFAIYVAIDAVKRRRAEREAAAAPPRAPPPDG